MLRKTRIAVAAASAAVALTLAACAGGSGGTSGAGAGGGTLTLGALVPATTQEAAAANWGNESPYVQAVYDSLLHEAPDATIQPWLATSWTYDAAKTVLTLKLRTDVKFTDGTAFNAGVAAQNVLRFRDGASSNKADLASVADAKAVDDSTLQITLKQPDPALLTALAKNGGAQESPKAFGAADVKTKPVGSGPYILDTGKTVIGSKYVYTRNPNYWAKDAQHYANLVINVYGNISTQVNAIRGGQISGVNLIDNSANDQIKGAGYTLFPNELDWTGLMILDRGGKMNPALGNVKVRQAINYAIDRAAMLKAVDKGNGTVTGQIFNQSSAAYDPTLDSTYNFDPAKAKALLAEAGYGSGLTLNMPEIVISGTTSYDLTKQYLGDVGITVKFDQVSLNDAIATILAPKYGIIWFRLQEDPTAWQVGNFSIATNATFNPFHAADPMVDSLMKTIQTGSDADAATASKALNAYVVQQAWFDPWYRVAGNFAADKHTTVVQQSDNAYPYLWNITPKTG